MGYKGFRIIVDLSAFYKDHRNVARIFIKTKKMSTIRDVKEHIASLFNITDFFLVATGHFLPDSENISVLNHEELVVVTPNNAEPASQHSEATTETKTSVRKKKKRKMDLESIPEEVVSAKIRKRHKSKKEITYNVVDSDETPSESQNESIRQKAETETRSVPHSTLISSYRMPCLDTAVRLSRRVDSPIVVTKYVPPAMTTSKYLAERKINIVKIDLIKSDKAQSSSEEACELKSSEVVPKELVKHDSSGNVSSLEKNFVPRTEASNYTKIFLDQKDANSPISVNQSSDRAQIAPENPPHLPENLLDMTPSSKSLADTALDVLHESKSSTTLLKSVPALQMSPESATNADQKTALSGGLIGPLLPASTEEIEPTKIPSDSTTVSQTSDLAAKKKCSFGVMGPLLEQLRDASGESADAAGTLQQLGKRKRIRKHRKRSKKPNTLENQLPAVSPFHSTPRTLCSSTIGPSLHLKFESDEENGAALDSKIDHADQPLPPTEGESLQVNGDNKLPDAMDAEEASYVSNLDVPLIFGKESIENALLMGDKLQPKVGDVIAFKILKISNNYTPELSHYIVGRVQSFADQNVSFQILSGHEELGPISGKLSIDLTEDVSYPERHDFKWDQMLGARLLYP